MNDTETQEHINKLQAGFAADMTKWRENAVKCERCGKPATQTLRLPEAPEWMHAGCEPCALTWNIMMGVEPW